MRDILKRKIKTGDLIAYAAIDGHSGALRLGYVYEEIDGSIGIYVLGGGYVHGNKNLDKLKKTKLCIGNRIIIIQSDIKKADLSNYII